MSALEVPDDGLMFLLYRLTMHLSTLGRFARTDVIVMFVTGLPSSRPPATPADAILSSVARPAESMVPNTVYVGGRHESKYTRTNWLPFSADRK